MSHPLDAYLSLIGDERRFTRLGIARVLHPSKVAAQGMVEKPSFLRRENLLGEVVHDRWEDAQHATQILKQEAGSWLRSEGGLVRLGKLAHEHEHWGMVREWRGKGEEKDGERGKCEGKRQREVWRSGAAPCRYSS